MAGGLQLVNLLECLTGLTTYEISGGYRAAERDCAKPATPYSA